MERRTCERNRILRGAVRHSGRRVNNTFAMADARVPSHQSQRTVWVRGQALVGSLPRADAC